MRTIKSRFFALLLFVIVLTNSCTVEPSVVYELFVYPDPKGVNSIFISGKSIGDFQDDLHVPAMAEYAKSYIIDGRYSDGLLEIRTPNGQVKYSERLKSGASIVNLSEEDEVTYNDLGQMDEKSQHSGLGVHYIRNSEIGKSRHLIAVDFNKKLPTMRVRRDFFRTNRVIELLAYKRDIK